MVLFNSLSAEFKQPFGAVGTKEAITLTIGIGHSLLATAVYVVIRGGDTLRLPLDKIKVGAGYDYYSLTFSLDKQGVYFYRFEIEFAGGIKFVGKGLGGKARIEDWLPEWQLTVYKKGYSTPDFAKGGICYHIFVDRFARAEGIPFTKKGVLKQWHEDVSTSGRDGKYRADDFFGGNLRGITSKLDYLKSLNVSLIYLSPIFEAFSNHRYDTGDYFKIDPLLGSEKDFEELIDKASKMGIAVILDGVFNHTGSDSIYFNKYGNYDSIGAWQGEASPYYHWYTFTSDHRDYHSWWGIKNVPTIRRDCTEYQEMIAGKEGVIEKWTKLKVAGWRLDVADELSTDFIAKIRKKLKDINSDGLLIGEVWEDATNKISYGERRQYFDGNLLDGVMNYPFKDAILTFLDSRDALAFIESVEQIIENYPRQSLDVCLTILGSHDTIRVLNALSGADVSGLSKRERRKYRLAENDYKRAKQKLMLASLLQYFLPGIPTIYYGDEIGAQGYEDPVNRRPFGLEQDLEILEHYKSLGKLRQEFKDSFTSPIKFGITDKILEIKRGDIVALINIGDAPISTGNLSDLLTKSKIDKLEPMAFIVKRK